MIEIGKTIFDSLNLVINAIASDWDEHDILLVMPPGSTEKSHQYSNSPKKFVSETLLKNIKYKYEEETDLFDVSEKYELIISLLGFGISGKKFNIRYFSKVSEYGTCFCILPLSYLSQIGEKNLRDEAKKYGVYLNSVLILPKNNLTSLPLAFMIFGTRKNKKELIFKLEEENNIESQFEDVGIIHLICDHLQFAGTDREKDYEEQFLDWPSDEAREFSNNPYWGIFVNSGEFKNIEYHQLENEINYIKSDYKSYELKVISELCEVINLSTKEKFKNKPNAIYIPLIGNQNVQTEEEKLDLKIQNYCQVILKKNLVINSYVKTFLNSKIGKKFLELPKSNKGTIPRLTKHDINNLPIALPNLDVQKSILEKDEMLSKILNTLNGLKEDLSLNPMSSENEISKLNEIYDTTFISNKLVRLNSNLRKGESDIVEFKETFGLDKATSQKNKNLEFLISKTIAGFLNSNKAGTLYIGINDNAEIVGMEEEINKFYKSLDKFKLKFTDFLKHKIGEEFNVFINYEFINHTKGTVFEVSINPSDKPVYIDGDKFFYRTNPRTTELTGAKLVEYVNRRFK